MKPMTPVKSSDYRVNIFESQNTLDALKNDWQSLCESLASPNFFYEPWMALNALKYLDSEKSIMFVSIYHQKLLCGLFPLEVNSSFHRLPIKAISAWKYKHCVLCTPLIRQDHVAAVMEAFLYWLKNKSGFKTFAEFKKIGSDSVVGSAFLDSCHQQHIRVLTTHTHERAILRKHESYEEYISSTLQKRRLKEYRRLERRLGERGDLKYTNLNDDQELDRWIDEFLALESGGWKGKNKSAFNSSESGRCFFTEITRHAFELKRLDMMALRLDGKPIAMMWNCLASPGSFSFKIAYDENYAAYSPGVLLELENIRRLFKDDKFSWMDSCAIPNHPMIDRLWSDRIPINTYLITDLFLFGRVVHPLIKWIFNKGILI